MRTYQARNIAATILAIFAIGLLLIPGCGGEKQPEWDTKNLNVAKNGNLDRAAFFIANSNWDKNVKEHETAAGADLARDVVPFFGKLLGIEGEVLVSEEIPKTEELLDVYEGKQYEGTDVWMVELQTADGTYVQYMELTKADHVKTGMKVKVYGYPAGYAPGMLGSDLKIPVIVGKRIDVLS